MNFVNENYTIYFLSIEFTVNNVRQRWNLIECVKTIFIVKLTSLLEFHIEATMDIPQHISLFVCLCLYCNKSVQNNPSFLSNNQKITSLVPGY